MAGKKNVFCVEISDILEPEQEKFVIERIKGYVKQDEKDLREYFEKTDTIEVKRLPEEEAKNLAASLEGKDLNVKVYNIDEKVVEKEAKQVKCPKCGFILEFADWRCPECFYEFPDYTFENEDEESKSD